MSDRNKKQCIVLLPSVPHFERMFQEIIKPAINETGLIPRRVEWNASSPIPINIFVDEIEEAEALFADTSEHTAEIWLAVGCAAALGKPLCLISSTMGSKQALGIRYLPCIPYPTNALPSDYTQLHQNISAQLSAITPQAEAMQPEPVPQIPVLPATGSASDDELVSYEVMALTIIDHKASDAGLSPRELGLEMRAGNAAHLTSHAMNALKRRRFIESKPVSIREGNELHISDNLFLTPTGEDWLIRHGRRATARRSRVLSRARFVESR
jgi:hypothetical protein